MNRIATRRLHLPRALFALLLVAIASVVTAQAQTGIYGEFGATHIDVPTTDWVYGGSFGIYSDFLPLPFVHLGGDLRGSIIRPADNTNLFSVLLGPRLALHPPVVPLTPYVEALVGGGHFSYGNNLGSSTKFEYRFVGGVDHTIIPRLDWRIVEFSYGGLNTYQGTLHPETISTGLVLRLP